MLARGDHAGCGPGDGARRGATCSETSAAYGRDMPASPTEGQRAIGDRRDARHDSRSRSELQVDGGLSAIDVPA